MRIDHSDLDHVVAILQAVHGREFVQSGHPQTDDGRYDSGDVDVVCEFNFMAEFAT